MAKPECTVHHLGTLEYLRGWDLQKTVADEVRAGTRPNTLLLLEHEPVYTIGRRGSLDHVLPDPDALARLGIPVHEVDRGGQVTYHGPGQLVAYPILDLREWGGPLKYVRALERVIVATLADFEIEAGLVEGLTGVWTGGGDEGPGQPSSKIAAIGVKIARGVCYHGLALNVNTDLTPYDHIVPCGITDRGITSMQELLGVPSDLELVAYSLTYHLGREMGFRMAAADSGVEALFPRALSPALH